MVGGTFSLFATLWFVTIGYTLMPNVTYSDPKVTYSDLLVGKIVVLVWYYFSIY